MVLDGGDDCDGCDGCGACDTWVPQVMVFDNDIISRPISSERDKKIKSNPLTHTVGKFVGCRFSSDRVPYSAPMKFILIPVRITGARWSNFYARNRVDFILIYVIQWKTLVNVFMCGVFFPQKKFPSSKSLSNYLRCTQMPC